MFTCCGGGGICFRSASPPGWKLMPGAPPPPMKLPLMISASVGVNGRNFYADGRLIQRALNEVSPMYGGAIPPLKEDGVPGPLTQAAIKRFQTQHFGASRADGLIEPGRQTLAKLNEMLAKVIQVLPGIEDLISTWGLPPERALPDIEASFHMARGWVLAARAALLTSGGSALLERYFLLSQQRDQAAATARVTDILRLMAQFFARPGGIWGSQAFQPEPTFGQGSNAIAYCIPGSYHHTGAMGWSMNPATGQVWKMRMDTVNVTFRFVLMSIAQRAYTIVHELAHFVGRPPEIGDPGYFHRGTAQTLRAADRMVAADCYAMLVYQAGTGRGTSPIA